MLVEWDSHDPVTRAHNHRVAPTAAKKKINQIGRFIFNSVKCEDNTTQETFTRVQRIYHYGHTKTTDRKPRLSSNFSRFCMGAMQWFKKGWVTRKGVAWLFDVEGNKNQQRPVNEPHRKRHSDNMFAFIIPPEIEYLVPNYITGPPRTSLQPFNSGVDPVLKVGARGGGRGTNLYIYI